MGGKQDYAALKRLIVRALGSGAKRISITKFRWELHGSCQDPKTVTRYARPPAVDVAKRNDHVAAVKAVFPGARVKHQKDPYTGRPIERKTVVVTPDTPFPLELEITCRCRKCDKCRRYRQRLWQFRAKAETQAAVRTWFGTLTFSPEAHHTMLCRARKRLADQGLDYDALDFGDQLREKWRDISPELTKYVKRVRFESKAPLRIFAVCELHKSGLPHLHMLIHEQHEALPVKWATLHDQWLLGFSKWKLVTDERQATYLCKYLNKSSVARVRASEHYGEPEREAVAAPKNLLEKTSTPPQQACLLDGG